MIKETKREIKTLEESVAILSDRLKTTSEKVDFDMNLEENNNHKYGSMDKGSTERFEAKNISLDKRSKWSQCSSIVVFVKSL